MIYKGKARLLLVVTFGLILLAACGPSPEPEEEPTPAAIEPTLTLPGGVKPLGPDAVIFYGSTNDQNIFNQLTGFNQSVGNITSRVAGLASPLLQVTELDVLVMMVDTFDHRFNGTAADLTNYRNTKLGIYDGNFGPYWLEASFGAADVVNLMGDEILHMSGAFDDYFNRSFVAASLTSNGLDTAWSPDLTLADDVSVTFHVRDLFNRNEEVPLVIPAGTYTRNELETECQTAFDNVNTDWVVCSITAGDELKMQLEDAMVKEGSFIRVETGTNHATLGLEGPLAVPGDPDDDTAEVTLTGKSVPGGFPITIAPVNPVEVQVTIRDKNLRTRTISVSLPSGEKTKGEVEAALTAGLNIEFDWTEAFDMGGDRLALRLKSDFAGQNAAIWVTGGSNLEIVGLDGPVRVDGVVTQGGRNTVRGNRSAIVGEALSLYIAKRAAEAGIGIEAANEAQLEALVENEIGNFDSFLVLFVDEHLVSPIVPKRAGAWRSGYYNLSIPGAGDYTFQDQLQAGYMIGTGDRDWQTWVHELGHNLGFWDIYSQPYHDSQFDRLFDYTNEWEMMNSHWAGSHPGAWHKNYFENWISSGTVIDIEAPEAGATDTHQFTLVPLEYPFDDYAGLGTPDFPLMHVGRIKLSENHWVILENRQPGPAYSRNLPGLPGQYPPAAVGDPGGLFVADTVDPWSPFLFRSAVTTLSPHGGNRAAGMDTGDMLDLNTSYPAYDGIEIRVVNSVPGPGGLPDALGIEVERGPGDFIDLEIRPWHAPNSYATFDIWIDWLGNGEEDYSTTDPPLGNNDSTHWHPDGLVVNKVKVRVHNLGTVDAQGVVVRGLVNEAGMGDRGEFRPIEGGTGDSAPQDIPAGGFRDFSFDWRPTESGHTCIRAEIKTFTGPLGDLVLSNNRAQENIADFHPEAGSPYTPYRSTIKLNNDFNIPIEVMLMPTGLVPGMDLELERDYLVLDPDEEVSIEGRLFLDDKQIPPDPIQRQQLQLPDLKFNLHAFIATEDSFLPFGGITANVFPGFKPQVTVDGLVRLDPSDGDLLVDQPGVPGQLIPRVNEYDTISSYFLENGRFPPGYEESLADMDRSIVAVAGTLSSSVPGVSVGGETIDAVLLDRERKVWMGTATVGDNGEFLIPVGEASPGFGSVMLYYFGPQLVASTLGPVELVIP